MNTFKGFIHTIKETEAVSEKFQKREFIIEEVYEGKFGEIRNPGKFLLVQEKVGLLDPFKVGDKVEVSYDIDGRFWDPPDGGETICFQDHRVWKIEPIEVATQPVTPHIDTVPAGNTPATGATTGQGPATGTPQSTSETPPPISPKGGPDDGPDDLPF